MIHGWHNTHAHYYCTSCIYLYSGVTATNIILFIYFWITIATVCYIISAKIVKWDMFSLLLIWFYTTYFLTEIVLWVFEFCSWLLVITLFIIVAFINILDHNNIFLLTNIKFISMISKSTVPNLKQLSYTFKITQKY